MDFKQIEAKRRAIEVMSGGQSSNMFGDLLANPRDLSEVTSEEVMKEGGSARLPGFARRDCTHTSMDRSNNKLRIPSGYLTWPWKITIFNRQTIYKWAIFHGYVK